MVITDNGAQFLGLKYERLLELNHIQSVFSPVYHQRVNPVERRVQEFKKILRAYMINKLAREREDHIHLILHFMRNRLNSSIGQASTELLLGYVPPRPGAWVLGEYERPMSTTKQERINKARNGLIIIEKILFANRENVAASFQPEEMVIVRNFGKKQFEQSWLRPYSVVW